MNSLMMSVLLQSRLLLVKQVLTVWKARWPLLNVFMIPLYLMI